MRADDRGADRRPFGGSCAPRGPAGAWIAFTSCVLRAAAALVAIEFVRRITEMQERPGSGESG